MAEIISINRIPADFVANTRHLSVEDRGAYQEILDQIVLLGQDEDPPSLPDDDAFLARLLGWGVKKWRTTRGRLCEGTGAVLTIREGRVSQGRIVAEIEAARSRIEAARRAGRASGESRQKTVTLRERMTNGRSTTVERSLNDRSTSVEHGLNPEGNGSRTDCEPAINHELRTTRESNPLASASSLQEPARGDEVEKQPDLTGLEGIDMLRQAVAICCPMMDELDDFTASRWLRDFNPSPWWIAAAIFDAKTSSMNGGDDKMAKVKTPAYVTKLLDGRRTTGWQPEGDVREWVEFSLRTFEQRVKRAIEITAKHPEQQPDSQT